MDEHRYRDVMNDVIEDLHEQMREELGDDKVESPIYDEFITSSDRSMPTLYNDWFYITFGPLRGHTVDVTVGNVLTFPGGHVVLGPDLEDFYQTYPQYEEEE